MKIQNIILILKKLKKKGAIAIKQSFEDEGASFEEIKIMRKITKKVNLKQNIKIGGCEAKNDINFCSKLKVDGIVAPMVESRYALDKFFQSIPKNNLSKLYVNIETITALRISPSLRCKCQSSGCRIVSFCSCCFNSNLFKAHR